jgi:hypothetical protein
MLSVERARDTILSHLKTLPPEKELDHFSSLVQQLEDMLTYLLKTKDYALATIIVRSYHLPVDEAFRPRLVEAVKKLPPTRSSARSWSTCT